MASRVFMAVVLLIGFLGFVGCGGVEDPGSGPAPIANLHKQERFSAAMAGLIYAGDRVTVDPDWQAESSGEMAAEDLMARAEAATNQGRRLAAVRAFSDAVISAPWLAAPYEGLGRSLVQLRRYEWAVAAYLTGLEIDPSRIDARFAAANALQCAGRLDQAIDQWLTVVAQNPDHGPAHGRLVVGYFLRDQLDTAGRYLGRALALDAAVPGHVVALLTTGELPTALVVQGQSNAAHRSVIIGPQVRIDVGGGTAEANETTIAAADVRSGEVVAAFNDWRDGYVRVGVGVSQDGGGTWTDFLLRPPAGHLSSAEGDPMTAYDRRTGTLWAGGVTYDHDELFVARLQPGTTSFETSVVINDGADFVDKGFMGTGPRPGQPDSTRLFVSYHPFLQYSDDLGDSWSTPVALDGGFGHLPRVGPAGEVHIAYWDLGFGINIQQSFDGGDSVGDPIQIASRVDTDVWGDNYPGEFRVWPFTYIAVDPATGTLYCVWHDVTGYSGGNANVDLLFARSDDGSSWTTPVVINGDSDPAGDQFFPWLEVDERGWLHMMFLDTRNTVQSDGDLPAFIDAYYSFSQDGGTTWTEYRLTPTPFEDNGSWFIGDYCGLTVVGDRVYPVYPAQANGSYDIFTHTIICPTAGPIFADDFESGDTAQWSIAGSR